MATYKVSASAIIDAPAEQIYEILADYRDGHPRIVPKRYFPSLEIEEELPTGTIIRFETHIFGTTRKARAMVTRTVPGRLLVEADLAGRAVTSFVLNPIGQRSNVTITTELKSRAGLLGIVERAVTRLMLRKIYIEELKLLAAEVARPSLGYLGQLEAREQRPT